MAAESFAVRVVVPGLPSPLSYALPQTNSSIDIGAEVVIEIGTRRASGWVIKKEPLEEALKQLSTPQLSLFKETETRSLKSIISSSSAFLPDQLYLFEWMAEYYGASLDEVIENALPKRSEPQTLRCIQRTEQLMELLKNDLQFIEDLKKKAPLQGEILSVLNATNEAIPLESLKHIGSSLSSAITSLEKKGFLKRITQVRSPFSTTNHTISEQLFSTLKPPQLTEAQQSACREIVTALEKSQFSPLLLFGVTGSGKTEVYLQAIEEVLKQGGSSLVIVPEIALTPQLLDQFQARLQIPIALLHSQVGNSARWGAWDALLEGRYRVAVGARSAVFAPLRDLRLIIVDEEHESSYKQSDGLRYHGRDVAVMRAKFANCPVILGSATPSFESLLNAKKGRYQLLELPERATTRPVPLLEIVDLNAIKRREMASENISPQLHKAMTETLSKQGQVIILYNRRGFSSYLQCDSCSEVVTCPNCSVTLTYHQKRKKLLCHYCSLSLTPQMFCKFCRDRRTTKAEEETSTHGTLVHRGGGTERIVEELLSLFPQASIARMDRDSVNDKGAYRRILGDVRQGRTDILVGTQMVAKGHDLPGVTLVGIIDADVGLHLPDFRSSEKAFQLITQAAGRAGRGEESGRVIVQTREPNHPTIVATKTARFKAFARFELDHRKSLSYPPWGRLMRLIVSAPDKAFAKQCASALREEIRNYSSNFPPEAFSVLGPTPAPHERLRNRHRFHLLVKASSAKSISQLAAHLTQWKHTSLPNHRRDVRLAIDVDPVDML